MKYYVKMVIIHVIRGLLRVFYLFPVRRGRVVFMSHNGTQYSCNPKYMQQYLHERYGGALEYVWVCGGEALPVPEAFGARQVRRSSPAYFYHMLTCGALVINSGVSAFIPYRKKQLVINTWHGGGAYKKSGLDAVDTKLARRMRRLAAGGTDYLASSSLRFTRAMQSGYLFADDQILPCGMPRNDLFFRDNGEERARVYRHFSIPEDARVVLYAPTYRSRVAWQESDIRGVDVYPDAERLLGALREKTGDEWALMIRAHYFVREGGTAAGGQNVRDASDYPDMQELLCAADMLITDYSSVMWDFSLTFRPCFIFAPDAHEYRQERDFYTPMDEWPFPIALDNDELEARVREFEPAGYRQAMERYHADFGSYETGEAARTIGGMIGAAAGRDAGA